MSSSRDTTSSEEPQSTAQMLAAFQITDDYAEEALSPLPAASFAQPNPTNPRRNRISSQLDKSRANLASMLPVKQLAVSKLSLDSKAIPSSQCHEVRKAQKIDSRKSNPSLYFFKINTIGAFMPELEVVCGDFYHFLTPDHAPTARACFDDKCNYVGVASKAIPNFKSIIEDPLKRGDLVIETLNNNTVTLNEFLAIDKLAIAQKFNLTELADDTLLPKSISGKHDIKSKDLKNFRITKGLGKGLIASYIFEEGDLHRGNMNKSGIRIDFDMSLWSILSRFKASGPIDSYRMPKRDETFSIDDQNIRFFPNLDEKVSPYYWPTKPASTLHRFAMDAINTIAAVVPIFPVSHNAFSQDDNTIYRELTLSPVFNHFKFKTLLKYILTNAEMYHQIAKLHIRDDITYESLNVMDIIVQHQKVRIHKFKNTLINMPEFQSFLNTHGDSVMKEIVDEFTERNDKFKKKLSVKPGYVDMLVKIDDIQTQYQSIRKEAAKIALAAITPKTTAPRTFTLNDFRIKYASTSAVGGSSGSLFGSSPPNKKF